MKIRPLLPCLLLALAPIRSTAQPQQAADPSSALDARIIQVQVEYVEMPHTALTNLLFLADPKTSDATGLRKQVQEMVLKNEAMVLETQLISGKSGEKVTTESVSELIYPTEYEPGSMPCGFTTPAPVPATPPPANVYAPDLPILPTAFDTRNTGSSLEVESTLSEDRKFVNVHIAPNLVWHTGNTSWLDIKDPLDNCYKMEMPEFYSLSFKTHVSCVEGRYLMPTIMSPKDANGRPDFTRKVIVFVKCNVLVAP